jgi:hypothetical protein
MAKDAKGHGSEKRGGGVAISGGKLVTGITKPSAPTQGVAISGGQLVTGINKPAHQEGVDAASKGLFTDAQISTLREGMSGVTRVDPMLPTYPKLIALLGQATPAQLRQLADAKINFVSALARNRVSQGDQDWARSIGGSRPQHVPSDPTFEYSPITGERGRRN